MEFMGQNGADLFNLEIGVDEMRMAGANPKAIQAFFDMGCHFYGKDVVVAYLTQLGRTDLVKAYARG